MKWILIAIYLQTGSVEPIVEKQLFIDKQSCQQIQRKYMSKQAVGRKWSMCIELKEYQG